ncbi:MAG: TMEM175 family protein [Bacteroidota bacterium]
MSHQPHDIFENRSQFQLERLILFSDAVFAIAITLLVIELKIPELEEHETLIAALSRAGSFYSFFGLALSFAIIGQFWTNHHKLFGYVNNYTGQLLWLNLHTLFWTILMPFSTALTSKYAGHDDVWMLYCINLFMIGICIYFLWRYITNPKRNLSWVAHDPVIRKMARVRSLTVALIFLSGAVLCLFNWEPTSFAARFVFFLIMPAMFIISRKYRKKNNPA